MYKLYYSPGSCSLIVHCLLEEFGVPFELQLVDTGKGEHRTPEYRKLNPKGKVPALVTPDGTLTECVALVEYLCDRHDADGTLLGKPGTWQRARTLERIATLATEIHPMFNRYFHVDDFADDETVREAVKARGSEKLLAWFGAEDAAMKAPYWSGGDRATAADIYFMTLARWGRWLTPKVTLMKNIEPFMKRMGERPAVARAMAREGINPFGPMSG
jgi:glutathione S-transferase